MHLVRRFFGALSPAPPRPADVAWVAGVLNECELAAWRHLPAHDRRHSVRVGRAVEAALAGTAHAGDPCFVEAALLHDVGKLDSGLGVLGRVAATVAGAVAGWDRAEPWSRGRGITRRFGLYLRHPDLGAVRIRECGGSAEAAAWAACHQDPARHCEAGLPAPVVDALAAADDD
ncbi:MAG: hypothetical protein ACKOA9_13775 [Actinomycetota bacterium]